MSRFKRPTCETWRHRWQRTVNGPLPADMVSEVSRPESPSFAARPAIPGGGEPEYRARFPT